MMLLFQKFFFSLYCRVERSRRLDILRDQRRLISTRPKFLSPSKGREIGEAFFYIHAHYNIGGCTRCNFCDLEDWQKNWINLRKSSLFFWISSPIKVIYPYKIVCWERKKSSIFNLGWAAHAQHGLLNNLLFSNHPILRLQVENKIFIMLPAAQAMGGQIACPFAEIELCAKGGSKQDWA